MGARITEEDIKKRGRNNSDGVLRELYRRYSSLDERREDSLSRHSAYERQTGQPFDDEVLKEYGKEGREEPAEGKRLSDMF